ncbi:GntR family transcriptional regulator / MocR family aminotransferase, partial [Streptomyces sp. SolWspMP-sol7th]
YRRLTEDGHVEGRGRRGTVVRAVPRTVPPPRASTPPPADPFAPATGEAVFDALRELPARIDLTPGRPDLTAFPRAAWLRATRAVLAELPTASLGYGDPRGEPALRTSLAHWLARTRGLLVHPDDLLVVSGAAQALSLLGPVLRADGIDQVAFEDPGSLGVRQHLRRTGFATPPVPVDHAGIRVDDLRATGARAVLLTPAHQFPTGVVTRGARRRALLRWASEGGLVLEDDYDAEHRYDRAPVPPCAPCSPTASATSAVPRNSSPRRCASAGSSRPRTCATPSSRPSASPTSATTSSPSTPSRASSTAETWNATYGSRAPGTGAAGTR